MLRISLESLDKIIYVYLKESSDALIADDKFLSEMNDQFNFIIEHALKSYNQKILEDIATIIGNISQNIIEYRMGIGDVNDFALNWVNTLYDLFIKSYSKDRTVVCKICLEKINQVVLLTLDKGYYRSYGTYEMYLNKISNQLSSKNGYWSALLLKQSLWMYQKQFLLFLSMLKTNKIIFDVHFINSYFKTISGFLNKSKQNHNHTNRQIISVSVYGVESFAQRIAKVGLTSVEESNKRNLKTYMDEYLLFNKDVLFTNPEKNNYESYRYFPEALFLITNYIDLMDDDREMLVLSLFDDLIRFTKLTYNQSVEKSIRHVPFNFEEYLIDYFALLIYFYHEKPDIIQKVIHDFVDVYRYIKEIDSKLSEYFAIDLYKQLKLYSCWIAIFDELNDINKEIIELLRINLYEPDLSYRKSISTLFEMYGYPVKSLHGLWNLKPSFMWGNVFQEQISLKLNGIKGEHYVEFHEMLKKVDE
nr:hypothetical protein [uncultured Methanolobus sp.]